jgi:chromosomal replication initiator protein
MRKTLEMQLGEKVNIEYNVLMKKQKTSEESITTITYPNRKNNNLTESDYAIDSSMVSQIKNPFVIPGLKKVMIDSQLNPMNTFDKFVEGECNRFARSAAYAIAQNPGNTSFNPFMLFGPNGIGKTHLLQAIGNEVKALHPGKTVLYVQAERFASEYFASVNNKTTNEFINFYNLVDVLLIDDIYWLGGKTKTQEVFFHIFNHLHNNGKQIVITSDKTPKDMVDIEERLLTRIKWGLLVEMQVPDFQTRYAILERKMYHDGIILPKEVVEYVANHINTNVRDLVGAMITILAHASLVKKSIDIELAKKIIKNYIKSVSKSVSIDFIVKTVGEYMGIGLDKIKSGKRKREYVEARQISMYLTRKFTKLSLKEIGDHFGGKDHSTVIHSIKTAEDRYSVEVDLKEKIDELIKRINISNI